MNRRQFGKLLMGGVAALFAPRAALRTIRAGDGLGKSNAGLELACTEEMIEDAPLYGRGPCSDPELLAAQREVNFMHAEMVRWAEGRHCE